MLENAEKFEHAFKRMEYEDLDYILHSWDGDYDRDLQMRMIGRLVENLLSF